MLQWKKKFNKYWLVGVAAAMFLLAIYGNFVILRPIRTALPQTQQASFTSQAEVATTTFTSQAEVATTTEQAHIFPLNGFDYLPPTSTGCPHPDDPYFRSFFNMSSTVAANAKFVYLESNLSQYNKVLSGQGQQQPQSASPHFFAMPEFDDKTLRRTGGVGLFRNAYIFQQQVFEQQGIPVVFDCQMVYVPGQCKSHLVNNHTIQQGNNAIDARLKQWTRTTTTDHSLVTLDAAVMIYQNNGDAYYHAMIEDLPRLAYVMEFLRNHSDVAILASEKYLVQRSASFNKLLNLQNPWIVYHPSKIYFVKQLFVPTGTPCGRAQPKCIERLQGVLATTMDKDENVPSSPSNKKAVLVLQKRTARKIINHDELRHSLQTQFSECCVVQEYFGNESVIEGAALHRSATIIIGPHGAGLSSAIFARRNKTGLVELHMPVGNFGNGNNYCHQFTARAAGLETRFIQSKPPPYVFGQDFSVDIPRVLETVQELLQTLQDSKR